MLLRFFFGADRVETPFFPVPLTPQYMLLMAYSGFRHRFRGTVIEKVAPRSQTVCCSLPLAQRRCMPCAATINAIAASCISHTLCAPCFPKIFGFLRDVCIAWADSSVSSALSRTEAQLQDEKGPSTAARHTMRRGLMSVMRRGIDMVHVRAVHMAMRRRQAVRWRTGRTVARRTGRHVARRRTGHTDTRASDADADGHASFRTVAANHHHSHKGDHKGKEELFHRKEERMFRHFLAGAFMRISA